MRNNWLAKGAKYCPFIILIIFLLIQTYFTRQALQSYNDHTKQQYDTLREYMDRENVPPDIRQHILSVATSSSSATYNIISTLSNMQINFQYNLFIIFFIFYSALGKNKKEE